MRKTLIGVLVLGVAGALAIENAGPQRERDCMTFLGYHNTIPERTFTFEDDDGKKYGIIGHPNILTKDSLRGGERYRPIVTDPLVGDDRLISTTPCEEAKK